MTILNPGKRGALDHAILDSLAARMPELDARCVIVTGVGETFSAGYDISSLSAAAPAREAEKLVARPFAAAIEALASYPFPTVAALNGPAIGGGLELALACDLRLAARGVMLAMPPGRLGLVYSHTGIGKFIEVVGAARTRELFLAGRRIDADTAYSWGLVNALADPGQLADLALDWATQIAADAPLAQRGNKRVIDAVVGASRQLDEGAERELIKLREGCFASEDFREGVRAFAEKRAPRWQGR
ncbi:MAG TPA: enoyl-CoA hydratase-related protein [Solirubrobacteraceae bacterium]